MELLKTLYSIFSPSNYEGNMQEFITDYVVKIDNAKFEYDDMGNIYVTKGISETYPCIASHMDQVQKIHSEDFRVCETKQNDNTILFGYSVENHRTEGLGADDKNGIWVSLKMLSMVDALKCVFFVGEEIGCVGSSKANMEWFKDCRFVLQVDRKGNDDFVTNISTDLCSEEFIKDCNIAAYGYSEQSGLMTDVDTLRCNGLELSCCNMSCGYYNPHTDSEYTVWEDLVNCFSLVYGIVTNCTKVYPFEMQYKSSRWYYGGRDYDWYGYYDYDTSVLEWMIYELIEDCEGNIEFSDVWKEVRDEASLCHTTKKECKRLYKEILADYEYNKPVYETSPETVAEIIKSH